MKPLLSIVIPTLNEGKYITPLLKDLARQSEKAFEVVVIDGKSEDATRDLINSFQHKLSIRIFQSSRRNVSYQRNLGATKAKADTILFIDSDMRMERNFVKQLIREVQESHYLIYLPKHVPHDGLPPDELLYSVLSFFVEASNLSNKPFAYGPGVVFYKHFFQALGGYDEDIFVYEDHEIIQRAKVRGVTAKLLPDLPLGFSFRRFRKEGRLTVLSKYLRATIALLSKGTVDKSIFTYDMGGRAKYLLQQKKEFNLGEEVRKYVKSLKSLLEQTS